MIGTRLLLYTHSFSLSILTPFAGLSPLSLSKLGPSGHTLQPFGDYSFFGSSV